MVIPIKMMMMLKRIEAVRSWHVPRGKMRIYQSVSLVEWDFEMYR